MSFSIRLTPEGIRHETTREGASRATIHRPRSLPALLRFWHYELDAIDPATTLGDLLGLLRGVRGVRHLSALFSCDVVAFLDEAAAPAAAAPSDVHYLEVYNMADLSGFEPGPKGARYSAGRWTPPYRISRGFHGWGPWEAPEGMADVPTEGGIAIEFTPVGELVHLPLRYNPKIAFPREPYGEALLETEITITFGEFVHAVLWEIGFFGSPGDRNEQRHMIQGVVDEVEGALEGGRALGEALDSDAMLTELDREDDERAVDANAPRTEEGLPERTQACQGTPDRPAAQ